MIDAHNHLQDPRFKDRQAEVIATMKGTGITACVVNGTCEKDWPEVANLADHYPEFVIPAFGLHPWKVDDRSSDWFETLVSYLEKYPQSSIGECGLDRWMKQPDLESQHQVFRQQLRLGAELNRPVTIHCLKAWGPLMQELHAAKNLPDFLLHSFSGSQEIANECLRLGAHFSFSGYFLQPRKSKVREVFRSLPPEVIHVETDAPDMAPPSPKFTFNGLNHPANLATISSELSSIVGVNENIFTENTERLFGQKFDTK